MSDDDAGARIGIPATLVTGLNAQVMLECLWWYMHVAPLLAAAPAAQGGEERPEEAVFVRLAYDDVMAIEDGEIMDLGPAPSARGGPSMLNRVLGGLAELLGSHAPTQQVELALDQLTADDILHTEELEEEEEEESDEEESDDEEEEDEEDEEWEEDDEEESDEEDEEWEEEEAEEEKGTQIPIVHSVPSETE